MHMDSNLKTMNDEYFMFADGYNEQLDSAAGSANALSPAKLSVLGRICGRLHHLASPGNDYGREILDAASKVIQQHGSETQSLAAAMVKLGFEATIRSGRSETSRGEQVFLSLQHEFLVVRGTGEFRDMEFIVEPSLRQHFSIPHPSPEYDYVLSRTPDVFVGGSCRLVPVVQLLCALMADSFQRQGLPLPPWRRETAMLSKWMPRPHLSSECPVVSETSSSSGFVDAAATATAAAAAMPLPPPPAYTDITPISRFSAGMPTVSVVAPQEQLLQLLQRTDSGSSGDWSSSSSSQCGRLSDVGCSHSRTNSSSSNISKASNSSDSSKASNSSNSNGCGDSSSSGSPLFDLHSLLSSFDDANSTAVPNCVKGYPVTPEAIRLDWEYKLAGCGRGISGLPIAAAAAGTATAPLSIGRPVVTEGPFVAWGLTSGFRQLPDVRTDVVRQMLAGPAADVRLLVGKLPVGSGSRTLMDVWMPSYYVRDAGAIAANTAANAAAATTANAAANAQTGPRNRSRNVSLLTAQLLKASRAAGEVRN